jgi:glycosyltransferase involved in cell wall biosynthesis
MEAVENFGVTFKKRDIKDLKKQLEYLIHTPEKVREKKDRSREYVLKNYSWDSITDQMEDLYYSTVRR